MRFEVKPEVLASKGVALRNYAGMGREIDELIKQALQRLGLPEVDFGVEHPSEEAHGDFSTNVALRLGKRELAQNIAGEINKKLPEWLAKVEVAGPGFINFYLSEYYLLEELKRVLDLGEKYGSNQLRRGEKVMVEFTEPNPFKEFHIGHLYSNAVGEALCRLWEFNGAMVRRVNYQGDVGMHVAKALWGWRRMLNAKLQMLNLEKKPLKERVEILGQAYAEGAKVYEEDNIAKAEIEKINQQVYSHDPEIEELYQKGRAWSLEYFETIYARLGTKFDYYYFESQAAEVGMELVQGGLKRGIFKQSKGAIVFEGPHTRVFINTLGLPTYEAKELGLAPTKYKDWAYDRSVIVTANEINEYFKVLIAAMKLVEPELGAKTEHVGHGFVKLPEGKMSSRTGNIITGEWLVDEVKRKVLEVMKDGVLRQAQDATAEAVAIGAVKYALLKSSIGQDIVFDFDKSVSLQGNSGPYLQYTYARAKSVLQKALASQGVALRSMNTEELTILRWIYRFPEVVITAGERYEPSQISTYLYELAQRFNTFYNKHTILGSDFRLALTAAVGQVIKNGLWLLGIKAPEKM